MTQYYKELLLRDLSARLQYNLHCRVFKLNGDIKENDDILYGAIGDNVITLKSDKDECLMYYQIKPYLRPMSSMTEEEKKEIKCRWVFTEKCRDENDIADINNRGMVEICDISSFINWLISHHFDYNGLIPMGLALEAPEDMYKNI